MEPHIKKAVECPHCKEKQIVDVRARPGFGGQVDPQRIDCLKCRTAFEVMVPDQIIGGPHPTH